MTDKERVEEVREKVEAIVRNTIDELRFNSKYLGYDKGMGIVLDPFIDRILSLKDKDGKPMLGIISDNQSLPPSPYHWNEPKTEGQRDYLNGYEDAQRGMLASNFVKIIKEG